MPGGPRPYRAGDAVGHRAPDCRTEHPHPGPYPRLPCEAVGVPFGVRRDVTDRGSALTDPAGAPCAGGDDHGIRDEEAIIVDGAREQGGFALRRRFLVTILAVPADEDIAYPAQFVQPSVHLVPPGIASFRFRETGALFPGHPIAALKVDRMVPRVELGQRLRAEDLDRLPELCDPYRIAGHAYHRLRTVPHLFCRCSG